MENNNNNDYDIDPGFGVADIFTPYGTVVPPGLPGTPFFSIYCTFLSNITDDLYLEMTYEDTFKMLEKMLLQAIAMFKWPRFPKYAFNREIVTMIGDKKITTPEGEETTEEVVLSKGCWTVQLSLEEIDILSDLMMIKWMDTQLFSANNTVMKYSSADFKFTSQANHISKLSALRRDLEKSVNSKQSMYRRQKVDMFGNVTPDYDGLSTPQYYKVRGDDWWNTHIQNMEKSEQGLLGNI